MIIDDVHVHVQAGKGGDGAISFRREKFVPKGGPDGGNGGNGGHVIFRGVRDLSALHYFRNRKEIEAEKGQNGMAKKKHGKRGEDLIVDIPIGTVITDEEKDRSFEIEHEGEEYIIARGGRGGRGNWEFRSNENKTPRFAEDGRPGQEMMLHLNMRYIADVGLIGLPSAGKSSLLNALTKAEAKVGAYPFTTLEPNLGALGTHIIADIPGLIEGAHEGKGLGVKFLKHIEKTIVLLHCIDCTTEDPIQDYKTIRGELEKYNPKLSQKKEIILLTKTDLLEDEEKEKTLKKLKKKLEKFADDVLSVSIIDDESLKKVRKVITSGVK